jgi:ABC-type polysaccharide/polyol phosphate transport system ATPase subunit
MSVIDIPVRIKGLKKSYKLYDKPSARLKELVFRRNYHREFIALEDITLNVRKGETLGIIGENGAGKSTLLKVIAKTLQPTEGEIQIDGRVSSLLELGSGFHPEFSGMDNIYFYGSLIGIPPSEMKERREEIISFAEIGEHINYPLKTYSSGMFVRLAFSVAMAVRPDILVVDEALSVGDLYFQKKSTDKILAIKESGKTIVFCSHSMYYITRLCNRVVWLKNGRIAMEGPAHEVTQAYETYQLKKDAAGRERVAADKPAIKDAPLILIKDIIITPFPSVRSGGDLNIEIVIETNDNTIPYRVAAVLKRIDEITITGMGTTDYGSLTGKRKVSLSFPSIQLRQGTFFFKIHIMDENFVHIYDSKASSPFNVPKETVETGFMSLPYKWSL